MNTTKLINSFKSFKFKKVPGSKLYNEMRFELLKKTKQKSKNTKNLIFKINLYFVTCINSLYK